MGGQNKYVYIDSTLDLDTSAWFGSCNANKTDGPEKRQDTETKA